MMIYKSYHFVLGLLALSTASSSPMEEKDLPVKDNRLSFLKKFQTFLMKEDESPVEDNRLDYLTKVETFASDLSRNLEPFGSKKSKKI